MVPDYYLVETQRGPGWVEHESRRRQPAWDKHAAFMDGLVEDGFVVLGGPIGELDGDQALLVVAAGSEEEARRKLAADPWTDAVLTIRSVRPWTIWLRQAKSDTLQGDDS
jgi:uncharacterized protein YciI